VLEQGGAPAALELVDQAVSIDEDAVRAGKDGASYLPVLLTHRSEIEIAAHRSDQAVTDAVRALDQFRSELQPGTFSSDMGHAWLALGSALSLQGRQDEARAAFRSALEHLQATVGPDHPDTVRARRQAES